MSTNAVLFGISLAGLVDDNWVWVGSEILPPESYNLIRITRLSVRNPEFETQW